MITVGGAEVFIVRNLTIALNVISIFLNIAIIVSCVRSLMQKKDEAEGDEID